MYGIAQVLLSVWALSAASAKMLWAVWDLVSDVCIGNKYCEDASHGMTAHTCEPKWVFVGPNAHVLLMGIRAHELMSIPSQRKSCCLCAWRQVTHFWLPSGRTTFLPLLLASAWSTSFCVKHSKNILLLKVPLFHYVVKQDTKWILSLTAPLLYRYFYSVSLPLLWSWTTYASPEDKGKLHWRLGHTEENFSL